MNEDRPFIHTDQDNVTQSTLVAYRALDGRIHVERVTTYLYSVLKAQGLEVWEDMS